MGRKLALIRCPRIGAFTRLFAVFFLLAACVPMPPAAPVGGTATASSPTSVAPATVTPGVQAATVVASLTPSPPATQAQPQPPTETSTAPPAGTATESPSPTAVESAPEVNLLAVGDLMLARSVGDRILSAGPQVPFSAVIEQLTGADLLVGNLECVISDVGEPEPKAYVFQAPPAAADSLALAQFDLVSLANNHSLDYGLDGLADMLLRLRQAGIASVGAGADGAAARAPVVFVRNGLRVAFLAYVDVPVEGRTGFDTASWSAGPFVPGVAWAHTDHIASDVAAARGLADVVVVLMHFGLEGRRDVTAAQRLQARTAVDAGASLVLGAHAHMLQPVEEYNGGVIAYGLGNFVFDGFAFPANYSAIFTATLTAGGVADYGWIPVAIEAGLPRPARPDEATIILARVQGN